MSVYVDDPIWPYRNMVMCHMLADSPEELHAMADRIGVARKWFQSFAKASRPHYDIARCRRELAIQHGAIEVDRHGMREVGRRILANAAPWLADPDYLAQKITGK